MQVDLNFKDGIFEVLLDGVPKIHQSFAPSATGIQIPWQSKAEALAWWDTMKDSIIPIETPSIEITGE